MLEANARARCACTCRHQWTSLTVLKTLNVPVAMIMGRHDMVTPTELAREYYDQLQAPSKAWYVFEQTAHFPHFEQPRQFSAALAKLRERWGDCPSEVAPR